MSAAAEPERLGRPACAPGCALMLPHAAGDCLPGGGGDGGR